jgi:hypothetical protein
MHLVEQEPRSKEDVPKALACYGILLRHCPQQAGQWEEQIWLRFVDGRPLSAITAQYLEWCCVKLAAQGKRVLILVWDNAVWHLSRAVQNWIRMHNQEVPQKGGVRIYVCPLPIKSPWLNPIEPKWVHGKRRVMEAEGTLSPQTLEERVESALGCAKEPHLTIPENVP